MDRLISEQAVLKEAFQVKRKECGFIDVVEMDAIKAIPSAEPYKGMTNGEVIKALFPNTKIITQHDNPFGDRFMVFNLDNKMSQEVCLDWWNSPYEPQERSE